MSDFQIQYTCAVRGSPVLGEKVSGDQYLIHESENSILIAMLDGLGHGKEAAYASSKAIEIIKENAHLSLKDIILACNEKLQITHGVVLSLVRVDYDYQVTWVGVGNVLGLWWGQTGKEILLSQGGVVGLRIPNLHPTVFKCAPQDTLIMATDGIYDKFVVEPPKKFSPPAEIANYIHENFRNPQDDALVLVIRWMTPHGK